MIDDRPLAVALLGCTYKLDDNANQIITNINIRSMRSTTFSFSSFLNQEQRKRGGIAILTGGLLEPKPVEYMTKVIAKFSDSNAIKKEFQGTDVESSNFFVFTEEHLDNPYLWLMAWGIENNELYSPAVADGRPYEIIKTSDNNIVVVKGGFESESPKEYMDLVVSCIVHGRSYNEFIESNLKNPYYRIIVFNINELPKRKFTPCQQQ